MRKLERTRIGVVIPSNDWVMHFGYLLEVVSFIGVNPVNKAYIMDGNLYRLFPTKGEAMEYAISEFDCGQVVYTGFKNPRSTIIARITDSPFFNVEPTEYRLVCD